MWLELFSHKKGGSNSINFSPSSSSLSNHRALRRWVYRGFMSIPFSKSYLVNSWPWPEQQLSEGSALTKRWCINVLKLHTRIIRIYCYSIQLHTGSLEEKTCARRRLFISLEESAKHFEQGLSVDVLCLCFVVMNISGFWAQETRCIISQTLRKTP